MSRGLGDVYKRQITKMSVPSVKQILAAKSNIKLEEVNKVIEEGNFENYSSIATKLCEENNPLDVISALLKMQFDKEMSFKYEKDKLEAPKGDDVRLFFSIGKRDGLTPKTLVKFIIEKANVSGKKINKVDILDKFSFVTVDNDILNKVMTKCIGQKIGKRKINIEVANKRK